MNSKSRKRAVSQRADSPLVDWRIFAGIVIIALGTLAVYCRTFSVPYLLDDDTSILYNGSIRHLWPLWPVLSPPDGTGVGGRPVLNLTFALNYATGGLSVVGYHVVNFIIHVLASVTLFALVRHTLNYPVLLPVFGADGVWVALAVSVLWSWHPVLTESVTYISQRAEALMGLFYFLAVLGFAKGSRHDDSPGRGIWYAVSVLACMAGAWTKESIITVPIMVWLYDRTFVSGTFGEAGRRHWGLYLLLALVLMPVVFRELGPHSTKVGYTSHAGGDPNVDWYVYGLTECRAVLTYLRLTVWPSPLVFDYGPKLASRLADAWPYVVALTTAVCATAACLRKFPCAGFALAWFFVIVAPTSSIVPIPGQPIAENRVYLPLAGIAALVACTGYARLGRWVMPLLLGASLALGAAAFRRNADYLTKKAIWSDTVRKNPTCARASVNLANALVEKTGHLTEAVALYREAIRLQPKDFVAYNDLAYALYQSGSVNEATAVIEKGLVVNPDYAPLHVSLGNVLAVVPGRQWDAASQFREALRLQPDLVDAHINLANILIQSKSHLMEAAENYEEALRLRPERLDAHYNLALALLNLPNRRPEAEAHLEAILRLDPSNELARKTLDDIRSHR
jgi:cytochrome c-type biogenesis protein CcmH/NrfG